ncbi:MAG TPA: di-heme oxidoredictase family protein [Kofleriaceae bacterium]|nr:di-heme oxidoredictase family protein [Kofleriaceae bacterium]
MSSISRNRMRHQASVFVMCSGVILSGVSVAGCAADPAEDEEQVAFASTDQAIEAVVGDPLPGITADAFAEAKAEFEVVAGIDDGLGPIFNERGCAICHSLGASGGAGVQIERRFGKFNADGTFNTLANKGGSLRQLFSLGTFTGLNGQTCTVPLEVEPPEATVHNIGRLTTPLFGAGLIDAIPDSVIAANASAQGAAVRGIVNRVRVLLPNQNEPGALNTTRVGRFGWKAGIANLAQFSADAYLNEMGITSQHCVGGASILTFASESKPNGVAVPAGCDDRAVPSGVPGVPAETDDVVGSCAGGLTEIEEDVGLFTTFMTFLAPAPRLPIDPAINLQGGTVFNRIGCAQCHLLKDYVTPSQPLNGVPGNFTFRPRSDFLLHDIGTGDGIGEDGDSRAKTNMLRTPPLWGLHLRTKLLHDGTATTIEQAIARHGGQAAASRSAFNALSTSDRNAMLAAMKSD